MADSLRTVDFGKGGLRHQGLREALLSDISKVRELPHGYAFLVSNSPATLVLLWFVWMRSGFNWLRGQLVTTTENKSS